MEKQSSHETKWFYVLGPFQLTNSNSSDYYCHIGEGPREDEDGKKITRSLSRYYSQPEVSCQIELHLVQPIKWFQACNNSMFNTFVLCLQNGFGK